VAQQTPSNEPNDRPQRSLMVIAKFDRLNFSGKLSGNRLQAPRQARKLDSGYRELTNRLPHGGVAIVVVDANHLFVPSTPAYKTPGSRRSIIARVAGRGFGYGFDAQSSRLFQTGARRGSRYQKLGRVHVNEGTKSQCRSRL
jgi:hypothetical protein